MLKVYTIAYNRPDLIALQYESLFRFLKDDFSMAVINNGNTPTMLSLNDQEASKLPITSHRVIGAQHDNAGYSHQKALEFTLKLICEDKHSLALIVDSDIFLLAPYHFDNRYPLTFVRFAGLAQGEKPFSYLWPGFLFINRPIIDNLESLHLKGVLWNRKDPSIVIIPNETFNFDDYPNLREDYISSDTGGGLALFEKDKRTIVEISVDYLRRDNLRTMQSMPERLRPAYRDEFNFWMLDDSWLHIGRGSNWDKVSDEEVNTKTRIVREWVHHE